ncbi:TIGR02588 family protein [Ramlibacter pallidus]|uniref:TIGR02588 family protein n=1 Tax=Ramlibacter pallidus TaxID=2780087 RepID=A0ABR9RXT2_9BURK|nr:TIGR02588 family protein [Ramlibacter pallidus]MBE7366055.1 TIGR02588 family protein [Ramlibacter pallidus]
MANTRDNPKNPAGPKRQDGAEPPPPFWEWVAAGVGLLLLVASIGYLLVDAVTARDGQPQPRIEIVDVAPQGGQFVVRLKVHNDGRATAAALRVAGELRRGETVLESSELELDYLPGRSSREAALLFTQDPRTLQLALSSRSWQKP